MRSNHIPFQFSFQPVRDQLRLRRVGWILLLATGAYLALYLVWFLFLQTPTNANSDIGNLCPLPLNLGASIFAWCVAIRQRNLARMRRAWAAFGMSMLLIFVGNFLYTLYEWNGGTAPFPSVCDALYLGGYVFMIGGLLRLGSSPQSGINRIPFWLDFSVVAVGTGMALWAFVLAPILTMQQPSIADAVVTFGYPIGDILILFGVFTVMLRRPQTTSAIVVNLLILAFVIDAVADLIYLRQALEESYVVGTSLDIVWMLYYLFVLWAGVLQYYRIPGQPDAVFAARSSRIWLPYPAMIVGYGTLFIIASTILTTQIGLMIVCSAGLTSLIIMRQIIAVRADLATQAKASAVAAALDRANADLERQRVELALNQSEAGRRALFEALPDALLRLDHAGVILDYRAAQDDTLGLAYHNLRGSTISILFAPAAIKLMLGQITHTFDLRVSQTAEYKRATTTGRDVEARTFVNNDDVMMIVRDISERARVENLKNEFVSTVSHELRTPLTSIRGSLGLVSGGVTGELPVQAKEMIDIAYANSERLVRLINDILDIQKIEAGAMPLQLQPVQLQALVERTMIDNTAFASQFDVALQLRGAGEDVWVRADTDRLVQVFTNIISNAVKFSPAHAIVDIYIAREGDLARVAVADHGPGIPEAFLGQIFQKFAQADGSDARRKTGSGLGLSIAKALTEQFGGNIWFTTASSGTTFFVDLPVYTPA